MMFFKWRNDELKELVKFSQNQVLKKNQQKKLFLRIIFKLKIDAPQPKLSVMLMCIYLGLAVFVLQTVYGFFDHLNVNVVLSFFNHNQFLRYFLENKWGKIEFSLQ